MIHPFSPGATATVATSTTTANVAIPAGAVANVIRVFNVSSGVMFVALGTSGVSATTSDYPIAPNSEEIFAINPTVTHVAGIHGSGTGVLHVTRGGGGV